MIYKRRDFLKVASAATAGLTLSSITANAISEDIFLCKKKLKTFGLQLYTLRDDLPKDPAGVLTQVASFGYKQIEGYDGPQGMFWNMGNKGFAKFIEDLGMKMHSVHTDVYKEFEKKVDETVAIGLDYIIYNWEGPKKTIDDYRRMADDFNKKGEYCKQHGIRFAFHNHDYTFIKQNGEFGQDVLLKNTDPALVYFEMDMYWVFTAGQNPIEWMDRYPNRFFLCHVKDRTKNSTENADTCTLGTGMIDYPTILKEARKRGMKYFIVEQERYDGTTPLACIKDNAAYMKRLKI
jgi:sugar phosphate isomerase/epimerase